MCYMPMQAVSSSSVGWIDNDRRRSVMLRYDSAVLMPHHVQSTVNCQTTTVNINISTEHIYKSKRIVGSLMCTIGDDEQIGTMCDDILTDIFQGQNISPDALFEASSDIVKYRDFLR
jgi:hypothetical protein